MKEASQASTKTVCQAFAVVAPHAKNGDWNMIMVRKTQTGAEWDAEHTRNGRPSGPDIGLDYTKAEAVPCEIHFEIKEPAIPS